MDFANRNPRVGVGVGVTIGLGPYEFAKPQLYMEIDVLAGEDADEIRAELEDHLIDKLTGLEEKLESYVNP